MKFLNDSQGILAGLQQFGKALMLPIAILPAAGLLLGIGSALSNPDTLRVYIFRYLVVAIRFSAYGGGG